jgi:hypothetical protein
MQPKIYITYNSVTNKIKIVIKYNIIALPFIPRLGQFVDDIYNASTFSSNSAPQGS